MRLIPTKAHALLDYTVGALIIAAPWMFGFNKVDAASWVTLTAGASALLYSLCTNYELGVFKLISMNMHLMLDIMSGIFVMVSPWLLGFADKVWLPHVLIGAFEILAALLTERTPRIETVDIGEESLQPTSQAPAFAS